MTNQSLKQKLLPDSRIPTSYDPWSADYEYRNYTNYPIVNWPNGAPCIEANLFIMNGMQNKGWSIKHEGGTVGVYANNLSHIIRFCFNNRIHFTDLTDSKIELFINTLQAEKNEKGIPKRNNTTLNKIGKDTLNFLIFVGNKLRNKNFIGVKGCRVTYTEEEFTENGITRKYVTHYSIPSKDPYKRRLPIAHSDEIKLLNFVSKNSDSSIAMRDKCLIKAYKATGGRRSEVANLRVLDIEKALSSDDAIPMLTLISLKQRNNGTVETTRQVPVYRSTLRSIKRYISKFRSRVIKNIEKSRGCKFEDHGYVFISETTGAPLQPASITVYFNKWAKAIGATGNVISHAFRHTYITEKIEMLIKLFELSDESELKAKFATEKSLSLKLLEWTGHKNVSSLENYIHLAFEGISGINITFDKAAVLQGVESAKEEMNDLKQRIIHKNVSSAELLDEVENLLDDLSNLLETDSDTSQTGFNTKSGAN